MKKANFKTANNSGYSVYTCLADFKSAPLSKNECDYVTYVLLKHWA